MKRILLSIFTLFTVLFTSITTTQAAETTTIRIGEVKAKNDNYYYESIDGGTAPSRQLTKNVVYYVYADSNASKHPDSLPVGGGDWVLKKDGVFKPYAQPNGSRVGEFVPTIDAYVYKTPDIIAPIGKLNKGTNYPVYNYKNGAFAFGAKGWVSAKDVDFLQFTNDKDTVVSATTIGKVASLEGDVPVYNAPNASATVVGTLKYDSFQTTLEVKGKQNGFYNVGKDRWVSENPEKIRFFPVGTETDLNKFNSTALAWEGTPYLKWGIYTNNGGFDEIGFVYRNFKDAGYTIGRVDVDAYELLSKKVAKPRIGDLVFFKPQMKKDENGNLISFRNIGIVVGENEYINAIDNDGVWKNTFDINNLDESNITGFGRYR